MSEQVFICYCVSKTQAAKEPKTAVLTPQSDGTVEVLRSPQPGENYSVKSVIALDNGRIVRYLYRKPTCPPKPPTRAEVKAAAIRKSKRPSE